MDTQDNTLAAWLNSTDLPNVAQYYRLIYHQLDVQTGNINYIQPVLCSEFYAEQIQQGDEFFVENFSSQATQEKLCPNTTLIDISQTIFQMSVISCADAIKIDQDKGWISYAGADTQCKSSIPANAQVQYENFAMGSQFDPETTPKTDHLGHFIQESAMVSFNESQNIDFSLAAQKQEIRFQPSFFLPQMFLSRYLSAFYYKWDILRPAFQFDPAAKFNSYIKTDLYQNHSQLQIDWTQGNILILLSIYGGLSILIYFLLAILLSNFQHFIQNKQMMRRLYGQLEDEQGFENFEDGNAAIDDVEVHRENFRQRIDAHKRFDFSYCEFFTSALFVNLLSTFCCCLRSHFDNNVYCRQKTASYKKFQVAKDRLYRELDIQRILSLHRISRLIHRTRIPKVAKKSVKYFERYVIRDRDVQIHQTRLRMRRQLQQRQSQDIEGLDDSQQVRQDRWDQLYRNLLNDRNNEWQQTMVGEVTGYNMDGTVNNQDSSDEDELAVRNNYEFNSNEMYLQQLLLRQRSQNNATGIAVTVSNTEPTIEEQRSDDGGNNFDDQDSSD